jgi:hypothetical protein
LGFFYDRLDAPKEWLVVGSRSGLLRFASLLRAYAVDPRIVAKSEHQHYGPYLYLKVMTWPDAGIDAQAIRGSLKELTALALLIEAEVARLSPGARSRIRETFSPASEYALVLEMREDTFDPASADPNVTGTAG